MVSVVNMKADLLRKKFPKVRIVQRASGRLYQVDARKTGTDGTQEHYGTEKEALDRAREIAGELLINGTEGLAMPGKLREWAFQGEAMLVPYGKTIFQACEFFRDHLEAEKTKEASALVSTLANQWHAEKKAMNLKPRTLDGIRQAKRDLKFLWGNERIRAVTTAQVRKYLTGLDVSELRKNNVRSLFSQFFNWCKEKERAHIKDNPCEGIKFNVAKKDEVTIFKSVVVEKALRICEASIKDLILYVAISAFAGLRPGEAEGLTWDNIHLEEKTITVLASTSKAKETHNVPIEDNLLQWLIRYGGEKKGYVCPQGKTLERRKRKLHAALGYKADGQNLDAEEMPQDVWRHSYASHWLAKHTNRATLAEHMANSIAIIKKHYKAVVGKAEMEAYWVINPKNERPNYLPKHLQKAAA